MFKQVTIDALGFLPVPTDLADFVETVWGCATTRKEAKMAQTSFSGPVNLGVFTVATAPTTASTGSVAYFSNGAAGSPVLAFYNGTNWLRVDTLAAISAS